VVLRPSVPPAEAASLALAVALGVVRGIERLGAYATLKWPNDVLLGEGKLAGVLLEMSAEADRVEWIVAGIGMNVRRPAEADPALPAAYLSDAIPHARLPEVAAAELDGIAETYAAWRRGGFAALRSEYEARFALGGQQVAVRDLLGEVRAEGEVQGVDAEGRLLVRDASGTVSAVVAGEVTLRS
jgi:BirA family biotin operon repressor/biotin-[acetyl-CoA-carboxylase] ligase